MSGGNEFRRGKLKKERKLPAALKRKEVHYTQGGGKNGAEVHKV